MKTLILKEKSILDIDSIFAGLGIFFLSLIYIGLRKYDFHIILLYSCISVTSILLLISSMNYEEVFKSEILLNSLPVSKEDIVSARYISTMLITLISTLFFTTNVIIMGFVLLGGNELLRLLDIKDIFIAISFVILIVSFNIPLYYSKYSKMRNLIFGVPSIILIGSYLSRSLNWDILNFFILLKKPLIVAILLIASLLIYYFSYELSKKIYINKEF